MLRRWRSTAEKDWWCRNTAVAVQFNFFLVVFPVLLGNEYGIAAASGLVATVLVRVLVLKLCRRRILNLNQYGQALNQSPDWTGCDNVYDERYHQGLLINRSQARDSLLVLQCSTA
jgi:hypothetical protein